MVNEIRYLFLSILINTLKICFKIFTYLCFFLKAKYTLEVIWRL
nr:MAG TPA: hypothetical protein [Caudoviricetes sp.]